MAPEGQLHKKVGRGPQFLKIEMADVPGQRTLSARVVGVDITVTTRTFEEQNLVFLL